MSNVTNAAWATHTDVLADYTSKGITAGTIDIACRVASDVLFLLTGSAFAGEGMDLIRPQARWRQWDGPRWWATVGAGAGVGGRSPFGFCSCQRGRDTGCTRLPEIRLPRGPVMDPTKVTVRIDGVTYVSTDGVFRIDDHRWLLRVDGDGWPCCQNLLLDDSHVHTFSVAYPWGVAPDEGGVMAAASLGYELALAYTGDAAGKACRLPKRITHMTRGQTSIALLDPLTLFKDGLTGLTEVDLWIASKMLGTARRPATVIRPGRNRSDRRTG